MKTEFVQFVPHAKAESFRKKGWSIKPLADADGRLSHHARHSVLAVRKPKKRGKRG